MLGLSKRRGATKLEKAEAQLAETTARLKAAQERIEELEQHHRELVNEKAWWQDQVMQYANQVAFWQQKNREILDQLSKERGHVDLRRYIAEVQEQIMLAAPKAAEVAAVIALSRGTTQGVMTKGFDPRLLSNVIDQEG